MDIQDLGAIGEMLGAVLLFASLLYVGRQIRETRKQMMGAAFQAKTDPQISLITLQATSAIKNAMIASRDGPDGLNEEEKASLNMFLVAYLANQQNQFYQTELGLVPEEQAAWLNRPVIFLNNPYFRQMWPLFRDNYPQRFRNHLDNLLEENAAEMWDQDKPGQPNQN